MELKNLTPFPAVAFEGVDQFQQQFHVLVVRQTYEWLPGGELRFAESQTPLCAEDTFLSDVSSGSPLAESDYCPFKPRCDILLNGCAYPPNSVHSYPPVSFPVRLRVVRPLQATAMPERPYGLNPTMAPSAEAMERWNAEVALARSHPHCDVLVDKQLTIHGPRKFMRRGESWDLSPTAAATALPVRLEHALGGQCRLDVGHPAAERVPLPYRLTEEQQRDHPDQHAVPVAHSALPANPWGVGFSTNWFLQVATVNEVIAPRIEYSQKPVTPATLQALIDGGVEEVNSLIAGFGVRPKAHPDRMRLAGTIDDDFISSTAALPEDHDFSVWQSAWPDQQVEEVLGSEWVELTNLLPAGEPGERVDQAGNRMVRIALPGRMVDAVLRLTTGEVIHQPMRLDTVLLEPDDRRVVLVWRRVLLKQDGLEVRSAEVISLDGPTRARLLREMAAYRQLFVLAGGDTTGNLEAREHG